MLFFGKPAKFGNHYSIAHPEIELVSAAMEKGVMLQPVYSITEKLRAGSGSKAPAPPDQERKRRGKATYSRKPDNFM